MHGRVHSTAVSNFSLLTHDILINFLVYASHDTTEEHVFLSMVPLL